MEKKKYKHILKASNGDSIAVIYRDQIENNPWINDVKADGKLYGFEEWSVEVLDIESEITQELNRKQKIELTKNQLKRVKTILQDAKQLNNSPEKQVIVKLSKAVLQISKALELADANESED